MMEKNNRSDQIIGESYSQEEMESIMTSLRKKGRGKTLILGALAALMIALGIGLYVFGQPNPALSQNASIQGTQPSAASVTGGPGAGGCGGGGAGASGGAGGCCGGGGAGGSGDALASASPADLEKQALAEYKQEKGATDVKAKATSYGCHIQIDISDTSGNVVRSYGYQGGPLYVIK